jgi:hypothetical protein
MHNYHLVLLGGSNGPARTIGFAGETPHEAFELLAGHSGEAELWVDDRLTCTLLHEGDPGVWVLKPNSKAA